MGNDGLGEHAEAHAIRRANRSRLKGSVIYIAAQRRRNKKIVTARPCSECEKLLRKYHIAAIYRDAAGEWKPFY